MCCFLGLHVLRATDASTESKTFDNTKCTHFNKDEMKVLEKGLDDYSEVGMRVTLLFGRKRRVTKLHCGVKS